jgi:sterol desaturase/sphingolipid hydroxylase (fatty acid hydroxylase superfamily)
LIALCLVFGSLLVVGLAELCRAHRQRRFPALCRRLGNVGIWIVNLFLGAFFLPPPQPLRQQFAAVIGVSLPGWSSAYGVLSLLTAFLLLDLLHYAVHRVQHAVPFLWRFHALHHSDPDVDVTTSVRHHPIEYLIAAAIYWLAVLVLDLPPIIVVAHALAVFIAAAITHGNIRLPEWAERSLQPIIITLNLHLIHHSIVYEEANSNFGAVLSIWDRLFGTFTPVSLVRRNSITFGIRGLSQRESLRISAIFLTPWLLKRRSANSEA